MRESSGQTPPGYGQNGAMVFRCLSDLQGIAQSLSSPARRLHWGKGSRNCARTSRMRHATLEDVGPSSRSDWLSTGTPSLNMALIGTPGFGDGFSVMDLRSWI